MTTAAQEEAEQRYVKSFLHGLIDFTSLEAGERPDFRARRTTPPDIALEVTEYHPKAQFVPDEVRRAEVESRWREGLQPLLERERQTRPSLQDVQVFLTFKDRKLPRAREHAVLARRPAFF
jgi:hypothetical protein